MLNILKTSLAEHLKGRTSTYLPSMLSTFMLFCSILILGAWHSPSEIALTWLFCLTGFIIGIPLGMLASPYKGEGANFRLFGGLMATFLSGYVVSKLEVSTFTDLIEDPLNLARVLTVISMIILGVVQTFIFRTYSNVAREHDEIAAEDTTKSASGQPREIDRI
ncbi:MAG: hypothetical protein HOK54_11225 [Alphaproteobacteria bacterium]|jgi:hypothetical protein|nr:hypothetical protein [Alphaproteobacteria bacterium]